MNHNYIIHGKRPGATTEEPLYTKATTYIQAQHIKRIIERDCKATECRIETPREAKMEALLRTFLRMEYGYCPHGTELSAEIEELIGE